MSVLDASVRLDSPVVAVAAVAPVVPVALESSVQLGFDLVFEPDPPRWWSSLPPVGFDLETTGPEPLDARIVQAAIVDSAPGGTDHAWLVDPGIDIPAGASAVHGISTQRARAEGRPAGEAVREIAATLAAYWAEGRAVVIYNAQYDLTVLAAELARHGGGELSIGCVVDPLVIWRETERYRRGKKRLADAAERFGVEPGDAHDATSDARAAVGVALAVCELGELTQVPGEQLMQAQADWHRAWATNFADWLAERGGDAAGVNLHWPVQPVQPVQPVSPVQPVQPV